MHYIGSNQQIVIETVSLKHLCRFWSPQFCLPFFNFSPLFSSHFFSSKKKGLTKDGVQFGVFKIVQFSQKSRKNAKNGGLGFCTKTCDFGTRPFFAKKSKKNAPNSPPRTPFFEKMVDTTLLFFGSP